MHKTKKKTAKLPKPIKVKKEKSDEDRLPQPMSHYIDDRLELVKQVFGSLKPKTIINLAPDFLKSQGLEDIEEACLNELLCISTKRLKSIITATKCPSDTESSDDNDDDVQRHEEHVSLEEISSDSEIEGGTSKKVKKKKSLKTMEKDKTTNAKTDKSKTADVGDNPEDGQISVLELLELQARARAIRSQLALEPVTKIEVDSDAEGAANTSVDKRQQKPKKDKKSHKTSERKRTSSIRESQDSANNTSKTSDKEAERKTKKIKLKRNYRNTSSSMQDEHKESEDGHDNETRTAKSKDIVENSTKQDQTQSNENLKKERSSRSPSPDVIPIVAEPETLLINDSSDEADMGNIETTEAQAKSQEDLNKHLDKEPEMADKGVEHSESEDGELDNSAESNKEDGGVENQITAKSLDQTTVGNENPTDNISKDQSQTENSNQVDDEDHNESKVSDTIKPSASLDDTNAATTTANRTADVVDDDEDQNDDIISLGEDLEDEMNEQLEKEANSAKLESTKREQESSEKSKKKSRKEKSKVTSSEDDRSADNQSWHSRYMKSSKVSKVLAASRLGKRVRDKIKKSKDAPRESTEAEKDEPAFTSKHEDGSLEQYKELLELRSRKSK